MGQDADSLDPEDVPPVFTAGRYYDAVVALFNDRYFDYARSGNMPLSGRGFVNNIRGGMGVFGSLISDKNVIKVVGDVDDPREGLYSMTGTVGTSAVDVTLELYVSGTGRDTTGLSTFVAGTWELGAIDAHAEGGFLGSDLWFELYQAPPSQPEGPNAYIVRGSVNGEGGFSAEVLDRNSNAIGVVTATRLQPRL